MGIRGDSLCKVPGSKDLSPKRVPRLEQRSSAGTTDNRGGSRNKGVVENHAKSKAGDLAHLESLHLPLPDADSRNGRQDSN
jgi:hypothetical protein